MFYSPGSRRDCIVSLVQSQSHLVLLNFKNIQIIVSLTNYGLVPQLGLSLLKRAGLQGRLQTSLLTLGRLWSNTTP